MKTFTNIVEEKLSAIFMEINDTPQLAGFITSGVPVGIAGYLASSMFEGDATEAELVIGGSIGNLMKFALKPVKKGDSIAFVPEFELLPAGTDLINSDMLEFDSDASERLARELSKNKKLTDCFRNAFGAKIYKDGEWVDNDVANTERGLYFDDESDIGMCAVSTIFAILEVLCNNKDASNDIEYEVPGFGKFKIASGKNGYSVTLTFDKEFKTNCKSDKLAEKLAGIIE